MCWIVRDFCSLIYFQDLKNELGYNILRLLFRHIILIFRRVQSSVNDLNLFNTQNVAKAVNLIFWNQFHVAPLKELSLKSTVLRMIFLYQYILMGTNYVIGVLLLILWIWWKEWESPSEKKNDGEKSSIMTR